MLIVEGHRDLARFYQAMLVGAGYEARTVHCGCAAINIAPLLAPDAVALNWKLADGDGRKFVPELRALESFGDRPIVAILAECEDAAEIAMITVHAFATSPVSRSRLLALLQECGVGPTVAG